MAEWERRIWGEASLDYQVGGRWGRTATNSSTGQEGTPITLTYSFVPDGINVDGRSSVLYQRLNTLFGSQDVWQAKFAQVFAEWGALTGIHYVQTSDDGAEWPRSQGQLGIRGDVRIGSRVMDGPSNVLAYNYYPDQGDMLLDADENWSSSGLDFIFFRNIVAHEHGHGLGISHVCPITSTKLLEPYYSGSFDGPQHDDIRAAQLNYGDHNEPNNTIATASILGSINADTVLTNMSLDHNRDIDYYQVIIPAGRGFTVIAQPVGQTYLNGWQNNDGSCSEGSTYNSLNQINLDLFLYNANGSTILSQSNTHAAGLSEQIYRYAAPPQGETYLLKVSAPTGNGDVQLYNLILRPYYLSDPYFTVDSLAFDTTNQNVPVTLNTWLVNNAGTALHVSAMSATPPFSVTPTDARTIAPHDSFMLSVTFGAPEIGFQTGLLTATHDGPSGQLVAELSGMSIATHLHFLTTNSINFHDVLVGTVDSINVPVRAEGNVPLRIMSIAASAPFSIGLSLPMSIDPTQTVFLRPRFAPTVEGLAQSYLVIVSNGITSPDTLFVRGNGIGTAAEDPTNMLPTVFQLKANYPNPFNPTTQIAYDLPHSTVVKLDVYDVQGRFVRELVNGTVAAGSHVVLFDGSKLASGLYLYRLSTPEYSATGKMMLMK
jgi:hypothetical protein